MPVIAMTRRQIAPLQGTDCRSRRRWRTPAGCVRAWQIPCSGLANSLLRRQKFPARPAGNLHHNRL